MQTGALLLDGNTLNYFGKNIPINLIVAVIAEIILVGGAEYYRIINGLVCSDSSAHQASLAYMMVTEKIKFYNFLMCAVVFMAGFGGQASPRWSI